MDRQNFSLSAPRSLSGLLPLGPASPPPFPPALAQLLPLPPTWDVLCSWSSGSRVGQSPGGTHTDLAEVFVAGRGC